MQALAQGVAGTGFQAESQEMCLETSASNRVSGFPSEFENNEDLSAGGKDSESNQQEISNSSTPGPFDRAAVINSTHHSNSPGNYDHEIFVDKEAEADLLRWVEHVRGSNGHPVVHPSVDMALTTDAFNVVGEQQTRKAMPGVCGFRTTGKST